MKCVTLSLIVASALVLGAYGGTTERRIGGAAVGAGPVGFVGRRGGRHHRTGRRRRARRSRR